MSIEAGLAAGVCAWKEPGAFFGAVSGDGAGTGAGADVGEWLGRVPPFFSGGFEQHAMPPASVRSVCNAPLCPPWGACAAKAGLRPLSQQLVVASYYGCS